MRREVQEDRESAAIRLELEAAVSCRMVDENESDGKREKAGPRDLYTRERETMYKYANAVGMCRDGRQ